MTTTGGADEDNSYEKCLDMIRGMSREDLIRLLKIAKEIFRDQYNLDPKISYYELTDKKHMHFNAFSCEHQSFSIINPYLFVIILLST